MRDLLREGVVELLDLTRDLAARLANDAISRVRICATPSSRVFASSAICASWMTRSCTVSPARFISLAAAPVAACRSAMRELAPALAAVMVTPLSASASIVARICSAPRSDAAVTSCIMEPRAWRMRAVATSPAEEIAAPLWFSASMAARTSPAPRSDAAATSRTMPAMVSRTWPVRASTTATICWLWRANSAAVSPAGASTPAIASRSRVAPASAAVAAVVSRPCIAPRSRAITASRRSAVSDVRVSKPPNASAMRARPPSAAVAARCSISSIAPWTSPASRLSSTAVSPARISKYAMN